MFHTGQINTLTVLRKASIGLYLMDDEENEVLLPNKYILPHFKLKDKVDVFIYKDSEERLIATTLEPFIRLHEFAYLQVKQTNAIGAFLDWGLEKDLMVPFKEQHQKMEEGKRYVVYLYLDSGTERLTASSKIYKFLDNEAPDVAKGDAVNLLIYGNSDLGYKAIINNKYEGLIYHNEVFQEISTGDMLQGYVKNIRPDNKIDISLQQEGYKNVESNSEFILLYLRAHKGVLHLTDKSEPEEITRILDMSKKTFKKAIGGLYKNKLIRIEQDGIYLV